jgi:hypothetical protein
MDEDISPEVLAVLELIVGVAVEARGPGRQSKLRTSWC